MTNLVKFTNINYYINIFVGFLLNLITKILILTFHFCLYTFHAWLYFELYHKSLFSSFVISLFAWFIMKNEFYLLCFVFLFTFFNSLVVIFFLSFFVLWLTFRGCVLECFFFFFNFVSKYCNLLALEVNAWAQLKLKNSECFSWWANQALPTFNTIILPLFLSHFYPLILYNRQYSVYIFKFIVGLVVRKRVEMLYLLVSFLIILDFLCVVLKHILMYLVFNACECIFILKREREVGNLLSITESQSPHGYQSGHFVPIDQWLFGFLYWVSLSF